MGAAQTIDRIFHALGDPTRRAIVARVIQGPTSVSDLAKPLKMTLAAVVQHAQILEAGGVWFTALKSAASGCACSNQRA